MSPSPRSSVDALTHSPSSPFFHNLSQRLRKGSTSSRTSSPNSEATQSNLEVSNQAQDAQSTKRFLFTILRDDWEYPTTQAHKDDLKIHREASAYRLRDESVSEYESPSERRTRIKNEDPYKFENPEEVGAVIERRRARKRRLLEQELSWNEGLRIWTLRRDSWTAAVPQKPDSNSQASSSHRQKRISRDSQQRSESDFTGGDLTPAPSWPLPNNAQNGTDASIVEDVRCTVVDGEPQEDLRDGPYLPIYPPLLPASHALRSRIKPSAYPTLYSKVVVQGLSPNVPIPLNHMINALVEGWKTEGNWPPQPLEPPNTAGRKRGKKGESAFQKWKREQDEKKKTAGQRPHEIQYVQDEPDQKGVRKSISGVVKKAFGMGGPEVEDIDKDLEKLGLTFEYVEDEYDEAGALNNGHV